MICQAVDEKVYCQKRNNSIYRLQFLNRYSVNRRLAPLLTFIMWAWRQPSLIDCVTCAMKRNLHLISFEGCMLVDNSRIFLYLISAMAGRVKMCPPWVAVTHKGRNIFCVENADMSNVKRGRIPLA